MVSNTEIINLLKLTIDHNSKQSKQAQDSAKDDKEKLLIKAGYEEIIDGHFDLLKMFIFIELIESNKLNIDHLNDVIGDHMDIINKELEDETLSDEKRNNIAYNKSLWYNMKIKVAAYMELLSPV